tara:strand:+ start:21 stop:602 length:582 start_codon:yes stop_codon:yes gene_type:complete
MAIDSGLIVTCADLQATGGIKQIILTDISNVLTILPTSAAADHIITAVTTTVPWARYEFKDQSGAFTISGTKENGTTAYECSLTFHVPNLDAPRAAALTKLATGCPVAIVQLNSDKMFVVGFSYVGQNTSLPATPWIRNQTTANLTTMEGGSGAAYTDENGMTVTLTATQYELPFEYDGAITTESGGLTATTV